MRILTLALVMISTTASADVFTVGSGAACTHATVQDAINAGAANGNGLDVINISRTRSYTQQALIAQNDTLFVSGGFADCASTFSDANNPTVLSGAGGAAAPVLTVQGTGNVTLRNLVLREGDNTNGNGGGLAIIGGAHIVTLNNVQLLTNRAQRGAGVFVAAAGDTQLNFQGASSLNDNQSSADGGGLYCRDANVAFLVELGIFSSNSASNGGGIYAERCNLAIASAHAFGALYNNAASGAGGGVYALGPARVELYSHTIASPTRVLANRAGTSGGAIFSLDGVQTLVQNVEFIGNSAGTGGAIHLRGQGGSVNNTLKIAARGLIAAAPDCPPNQICNLFSENGLSSVTGIAAVLLDLSSNSDGYAQIYNTRFVNNRGIGIVRSNLDSTAGQRRLEIANAELVGNQAGGDLIGGKNLALDFLSIGGNALGNGTLPVLNGFGGFVRLNHLAVHQPPNPLLGPTPNFSSISSSYLIVNSLSNLPPSATNRVADPGFVSASDLRLRSDARARDYALAALPTHLQLDLQQNPRPVSDPSAPDVFGIVDVGAYEMPTDLPEVFFRNGFEPCLSCF